MKKIFNIICLAVMIIQFPSAIKAQDKFLLGLQTKDSTYTTSLNQSTLRLLPFRGEVQEYYGLFPGTVVQEYGGNNYLHIRGSRHDEIAYSFEGIDIRSAFTGLNLFQFIPEALESISLDAAPSASAGNAVGLLNIGSVEGGRIIKSLLGAKQIGSLRTTQNALALTLMVIQI